MILLLSRYRKSTGSGSRTDTPAEPVVPAHTLVFDEATIQAFASLSQYVTRGDEASIISPPQPEKILEIENPQLSEEEVKEAAMNVLNAFNTRSLGGPMASPLCSLAENILAEVSPPPGFPTSTVWQSEQHPQLLSSLLNMPRDPPVPTRIPGVDPQLLFDMQHQASALRR